MDKVVFKEVVFIGGTEIESYFCTGCLDHVPDEDIDIINGLYPCRECAVCEGCRSVRFDDTRVIHRGSNGMGNCSCGVCLGFDDWTDVLVKVYRIGRDLDTNGVLVFPVESFCKCGRNHIIKVKVVKNSEREVEWSVEDTLDV